MKKVFTFLVCFLVTLALGSANLRLPSTHSCVVGDSCCCSDPTTVDPCVCADDPASDFPDMAAFGGLPNLAVRPAEALSLREIAALTELLPCWHPALPWHVPPAEQRARLSVWIL